MGKVVRGIAAIGLIVVGVVTGNVSAIMAGISAGASMLKKRPRVSPATTDRLFASINPATPRKMVFGRTALATDVRFQAYTGTNREFYHQIVACASHRVSGIDELWLDDKLAWSAAAGVQGEYAGYLTVTPITEGSAANVVAIDGNWGPPTNRRLTGCAYVHLRYKLTGNSKKTESPFANGVPSRMTIVGRGIPVYDPRRDSTVGGSGAMRANDQSTWAYTAGGVDIGRNAALCLLTWLLGWRINGKLAVGPGVPANRLLMASFMAAANLCEEAVSLAAGGSEPRYRFDGIVSADEDGGAVMAAMQNAMAADLLDAGGRLALRIAHNDLAAPVMAFDDDDIMGPFDWRQGTPLDEMRNVVRGRFVDPSPSSLFQLVDYPESRIAAPDGIDRILPFDMPGVQSASQAQRLARAELQRIQYGGRFTAVFNAKAWGVQVGDVVTLTSARLNFSAKLFRVAERAVAMDGLCEMVLTEENAAIYAWDRDESPAVQVAAPINYSFRDNPLFGLTRNADQGAWATGNTYQIGDEVQDQGSTWGAIADHFSVVGNRPPTLPITENATWRLRAARGDDGTSPPLITVSGTHSGFRRLEAGELAEQVTTINATRQNTTEVTVWRVLRADTQADLTGYQTAAWLVANGYASASASNDTISITDDLFDTLLTFTGQNSGLIYEAWINGTAFFARWPLSIVADGDPGAPGLSIAAAPAVVSVRTDAALSPKAGALPQTVKIFFFDGAADVGADPGTTYSLAVSGCTVVALGGGLFRVDAVGADNASFTVTAARAGRSIQQTVPVPRIPDGAAGATGYAPQPVSANLNPGPVTINYPQAVRIDAGGSIGVSGNIQTISNANSGTISAQIQISETGAGSWAVVASGSEIYAAFEPAAFGLSGSFTNSSGAARNYDLRIVVSRVGGQVATDPATSFFKP